MGKFTSLKIDSNNVVYISYYDATNGNLKLISILPSDLVTLIPEFGTPVIPVIGVFGAVTIIIAWRRERIRGPVSLPRDLVANDSDPSGPHTSFIFLSRVAVRLQCNLVHPQFVARE